MHPCITSPCQTSRWRTGINHDSISFNNAGEGYALTLSRQIRANQLIVLTFPKSGRINWTRGVCSCFHFMKWCKAGQTSASRPVILREEKKKQKRKRQTAMNSSASLNIVLQSLDHFRIPCLMHVRQFENIAGVLLRPVPRKIHYRRTQENKYGWKTIPFQRLTSVQEY